MAWIAGLSRKDYKEWKQKKVREGFAEPSLCVEMFMEEIGFVPSDHAEKLEKNRANTISSLDKPIDKNSEKIITIDSKKLYGISFTDYGCDCWSRFIYKKDTTVQYPTKEGMVNKTYPKGDFSKWELMAAPFKTDSKIESAIAKALRHIGQDMLKNKVIEAESIQGIAKMVQDVGRELDFMIKKP